MRILIINTYLTSYGGTEVVTRDLACEFRRQGHDPVVYSPELGAVAEEIKREGVEVTDRLSSISRAPDIIHGHMGNALEGLLHFPASPAVWVCHDKNGPANQPFFFPRILRYVGVDERCAERIREVRDIPRERIEMRLNAVDVARFRQRSPLPAKPKRALLFTRESVQHLAVVRRACRRWGLRLDVVGGPDRVIPDPERVLPGYDIVFAKARCALEALACGNAVVLCDALGLGPMVSSKNYDRLRPLNFGAGALSKPLSWQELCDEIDQYDAQNAAVVCRRVRAEAGLEQAAQGWIALYQDVLNEFRSLPRDMAAELEAAAAYLACKSYEGRVRWERQQLRQLATIPLVGGKIYKMAERFAKRMERGESWLNRPPRDQRGGNM